MNDDKDYECLLQLSKKLDEEKAIEYCGCNQPICRKGFETNGKQNCTCARKKTYLDGLKEGRKEKWHDLRKGPNDLPDHLHSVIVAYKNNSLGTLFTSQGYLGAMNIWNVDGFSPYEVIAWCELPKFEE